LMLLNKLAIYDSMYLKKRKGFDGKDYIFEHSNYKKTLVLIVKCKSNLFMSVHGYKISR
jgi:hypothetical protein